GSGRAGGGQLHRLRGGSFAEVEGHRLRDRDDGGGCPLADLRRGGGAVVPRAARVEGDRDSRRRDPGGFRGGWARHRGGDRERQKGRGGNVGGRGGGEAGRDARPAGRAGGGRRNRL